MHSTIRVSTPSVVLLRRPLHLDTPRYSGDANALAAAHAVSAAEAYMDQAIAAAVEAHDAANDALVDRHA
jgi:hypothetical protein